MMFVYRGTKKKKNNNISEVRKVDFNDSLRFLIIQMHNLVNINCKLTKIYTLDTWLYAFVFSQMVIAKCIFFILVMFNKELSLF
ncbi:hypothetical protein RhiirB3_54958 [Rhizophagus irregularis]|nr:hypothetical protein RhiirB3_54958 [Rhizophagus irregularis]